MPDRAIGSVCSRRYPAQSVSHNEIGERDPAYPICAFALRERFQSAREGVDTESKGGVVPHVEGGPGLGGMPGPSALSEPRPGTDSGVGDAVRSDRAAGQAPLTFEEVRLWHMVARLMGAWVVGGWCAQGLPEMFADGHYPALSVCIIYPCGG